jgi:hypothetical protein
MTNKLKKKLTGKIFQPFEGFLATKATMASGKKMVVVKPDNEKKNKKYHKKNHGVQDRLLLGMI